MRCFGGWRSIRKATWLYPVVYVWVGIFGVLATSQVWTLSNYVLTGRESKRLVGFIGTGGIVGGIVGGFLSNIVSRSLGAEGLFLVMGGSIAISAGLVFAISRKNEDITPALRNAPAIKSQRSATLRESFRLVISSPHLLAIAALVCICSIATYIAGWQFRAIVKETLPDKDAMAAFLGTFYGATGVLAMLIQVLLTPRLLRYFGIGVALSDSAAYPDRRDHCDYRLRRNVGGDIVARVRQSCPVLRRQRRASDAVSTCFAENKVQAKSFLDTVVPRGADGLGAVTVLLLTVGAGSGRVSWAGSFSLSCCFG